jgi:ABC-type uncharacterized transport system permease subunit
MLDAIIHFRGIISNLIGIAVWTAVAFGTDWPLWASIPAGLFAALLAALVWGLIIGQVRAAREGY